MVGVFTALVIAAKGGTPQHPALRVNPKTWIFSTAPLPDRDWCLGKLVRPSYALTAETNFSPDCGGYHALRPDPKKT